MNTNSKTKIHSYTYKQLGDCNRKKRTCIRLEYSPCLGTKVNNQTCLTMYEIIYV